MVDIIVPKVVLGLNGKVQPIRNDIVARKEDCCAKEALILRQEWSATNPIADVLYRAPKEG